MKRKTWQQAAVREALERVDAFVSAKQLYQELIESGSTIGLATVYRALAGFAEDGEADMIQGQSGETLYRACETESHHHHLICRSCGATHEIAAQLIEDWSKKIASEHGYISPTHEIDIFGLCPDCQELAV